MGAHHSKADKTPIKPYHVNFKGHEGYDRTSLLETLPRREDEENHYRSSLEDVKRTKLSLGGVHVTCWDFGNNIDRVSMFGRSSVRHEYRRLLSSMDGIFYVIDSTALEKLDGVLTEIEDDFTSVWNKKDGWRVLPSNEVIMILANKQDAEGALPLDEIEEKVKEVASRHSETLEKRSLFVAGCNENQDGLEEAMILFLNQMQRRKAGKMRPGFAKLSALQEEMKKEREALEAESTKASTPSKMHFLKKVANILAH